MAIPSVTGDTRKATEFLADAMRGHGFDEAFVDGAGNAVGVAGRGPREILLVGHIDTVPPGDLPVRVENGELHGRGAVDAKGPLVAFVAAAARFAGRDDVRVVVVGACDEEGPSEGARHLVPRYRPEHLVIGEPSGAGAVTIGYKGMVKIRYELEDDEAHSGAPHPSVPDRALAYWSAVQGYLSRFHGEGLFDTATVKLQSFTSDLLPTGRLRARLAGNARLPPGFDAESFLDFLRARAGAARVEIPEWVPAHVADKNSLLARAFVAAIREEGMTPRYLKKTGTADLNLLAPAWRVPAVAYGPGDSRLDHTPQERIRLDEFRAGIRVLGRALDRVVAGDAEGGGR